MIWFLVTGLMLALVVFVVIVGVSLIAASTRYDIHDGPPPDRDLKVWPWLDG